MKKRDLRFASALTFVALFGFSAIVAAQKPAKQKPRQTPQTGVEDVTPVTVDQAEGEALLDRMISRSSEGLVEVVHPNGSVSMDLQGRFMSVMLATPLNGGGHSAACVVGHEALKHAQATGTVKEADGAKTQRHAAPKPTTAAVREVK
jgi:hypothetical protein